MQVITMAMLGKIRGMCPSQGHEMLFDAHTRSSAALGGIPRRGIYDNMKTAVDRVKKGKGRVVDVRFSVKMERTFFYFAAFKMHNFAS